MTNITIKKLITPFVFGAIILLPGNAQADFLTGKPANEIRVLVAEGQKILKISSKGDYTIQALPARVTIAKGRDLDRVALTAVASGFRLGKEEWLCRGIRIIPKKDGDVYVNQAGFRGVVDIYQNADGLLYAVNRLDIEKYLYGVLHHEVAPWWPMEALKAQAVAARTYALYQASVSKALLYDVKSTTSSQVYGGSTTERYRTKKAVDLTKGQTLTYQAKIFPAYFHATCAGMTAGADELWKINLGPIAGGVQCNYCRISPHYYWHARIPLSDIEEKLNQSGRPVGQILKLEVISQTPSGRAGSLRITGTVGEAVIAAKDFRIWVGGDKMRSTFFTVVIRDDAAIFNGKGWGHGVGLCQWGSLGQSLLGKSYKEILNFYYPGAEITD